MLCARATAVDQTHFAKFPAFNENMVSVCSHNPDCTQVRSTNMHCKIIMDLGTVPCHPSHQCQCGVEEVTKTGLHHSEILDTLGQAKEAFSILGRGHALPSRLQRHGCVAGLPSRLQLCYNCVASRLQLCYNCVASRLQLCYNCVASRL
jgi:hypothetical protein